MPDSVVAEYLAAGCLVQLLPQWSPNYSGGASFYSDSRTDLPLLCKVSQPRTVNPDPALLEHARQAGWLVLKWA